jgi:hypothetical protein
MSMDFNLPSDDDSRLLIEKLADIEHKRWAHWQRYMHDHSQRQQDGSLVVPANLVELWERQINTPYDDLADEEKQSDREQVMQYFPLLMAWLGKRR